MVRAVTTVGAICLGAIAVGVFMFVAAVRSLLGRWREGDSAWPALWLLVPALALVVAGALLLARERRHTEAAHHVAKAKELSDKGLTERAQREVERALKLNPKDADAEQTLRDIQQQQEKEREEAERRRTQRIPAGKGSGGGGAGPGPRRREQPRTGIDIHDYHLAAELLPERHQLKATATITARPRAPAARELTLLLSPALIISSVRVDGKTASFKTDEDRLTIQLPDPLPEDEPIKVVVEYGGFGHDAVVSGGDRIAEDGCYLRPESQWYPSTRFFDFKTPVTLVMTVPTGMTVIGPGELMDRKKQGEGTAFVWRCKLPIRGIVVAAARYKQQRRTWRGVGISVCTFPHDKVIERGDVDEGFIAHEIAHQWWGHAVGVDGPGAGWVCEAFAEYSSCMYEAHVRGPEAMRLRLTAAREKYFASVGRAREQAIVETDPFNQGPGYVGVIYQKGAYVLHMLRTVLGDELFSKCMTDYALAYRGRNATISDFEDACAHTAGTSLDWFFDQWVYQPGAMRLTYDYVTRRVAGGKHLLRVAVQQETREPYSMPLDIVVKTSDGAVRERETLGSASAQYEYRLDRQPVAVVLDPDCNLLMHTPSKVRIDSLRSHAPR